MYYILSLNIGCSITHPQTQNDYYREYLQDRDDINRLILAREAPPLNNKCAACSSTGLSRDMAWRCHDCFGDPVLCTPCIQHLHRLHPFHRVSQWDGTCFCSSSLSAAGLTLNLGHASELCPSYHDRGDLPARSTSSCPLHDIEVGRSCGPDPQTPNPSCGPITGRCLSLGGSCSNEATQPTESLGRKRPFSTVDISAEACDPTVPTRYNSRFWESIPRSQGEEEVDTLSKVSNVNTTHNPPARDGSENVSNLNGLCASGFPPSNYTRGEKGYDELQCPILTVVDTTGIHEIRTRVCRCHPPTINPLYKQLIDMGLYPSSTERPRTVFTFRVLHHFDLTNLEGKTSAWHYYSTLRRLSSNVFPEAFADRYRELMRALRQWRDLTNRRRAGLPFDRNPELNAGSLALFCPACPQPGVNLPANWKDDTEQYVHRSHGLKHPFTRYF